MNGLIKLSERTIIILHALAYIAANGQNKLCSVKRMAAELKVSPTYLAKLLQSVVKMGLLKSTRGAHGGFAMAVSPAQTSLLDLLLTVNGPLPRSFCLFGQPTCRAGRCAFTELNEKISDLIIETLSHMTLEDFSKGFILSN